MTIVMKFQGHSSVLRVTAFASALCLIPALVFAGGSPSYDRAVDTLASNGTIPVKAAGPYVEVGTSLIQVAVTLGQPTAKLGNGTWLYQNHSVEGSDARGTLVVRFADNRVSELSLVTPAVATAMRSPSKSLDRAQVAVRR